MTTLDPREAALYVAQTRESLTVQLNFERRSVGVLDASSVAEELCPNIEGSTRVWFLNRLLVQPDFRKQGVGSRLLEEAQKALLKRPEQHPSEWPAVEYLWVTPGGYDSDPARVAAFYRRAGFTPFEYGLYWRI